MFASGTGFCFRCWTPNRPSDVDKIRQAFPVFWDQFLAMNSQPTVLRTRYINKGIGSYPILSKAYESMNEAHLPSSLLLQAQIAVIPKPGKDPSICSDCRPISLQNVDLKLFAKIITNRLSPLLPTIIYRDQVGFNPGREARDNTTKTLHLFAYAQRNNMQRGEGL